MYDECAKMPPMIRGITSQPSLARRTVWLCAHLLFFLISIEALAEEGLPDPKEDPKYRSTLKEALAEYDAGHFEEARSLFRRAHDINPNARTLRSIGMASFELRDYVGAVRALSASLAETRKALNPEQRAHAHGLLERSRMYVDVYNLKVVPSDARVLIDGRVPEYEEDGTLLLGFGSHNLEASRPGYLLRSIGVNVSGGEHKELAVTLERKATAQVKPGLGEGTSNQVREKLRPAPEKSRGTILLFAAGGAALGSATAAVFWLFANNELDKCRKPAEGMQCDTGGTIKTNRNIAMTTTIITGAAALTLATIGFFSMESKKPSSKRSSLSCSLLPGGFSCSTPF
jgi:hypothetical protein